MHRTARVLSAGCLIATCCLVLGRENTAAGHDGEHPHPVAAKPAEVYRPTVLPDRIVLTWAGNPAYSQSVTWRTSSDVHVAFAELAPAEADPKFVDNATRVDAVTQTLQTDLNKALFHTVTFENLKPATKYAYRVGDGVNFSEWFHFSTASDEAEPFSFVYFGDAQNNLRSMWSRVIREAYGDAPDARFLLHAGDLVNQAESDAEWGEWCGAGSWLNAMIPSVPVPGNHEQAKDQDGRRRLSHHWRPQFALPENGPKGLEESCFTLVYQGVRIVGLNSNQQLEEQAVWLDQLLSHNTCRWVIVTFHHPIYSTGKDRDNATLRSLWKPVLDKHHVDLVLQGHDHTYGRTGLETPHVEPAATVANLTSGVNTRDHQTGTVYVVSVSGPKMYSLQRHPFMKRQGQNKQLYQIISIDGDTLRFEARTAIGERHDSFTLRKRDGQINELIEE